MNNTTTQNNRKEIWKDVPEFEGYYQVSNKGYIRSLNYKNCKGYIKNLTPGLNKNTGYLAISLRKKDENGNTVVRQTTVHRIVAEAFIPNPMGLEQVDHIDGCRTRNCVSNLRWASRKFNNSRKQAKMRKSQNHMITSHTQEFVKAVNGDEVKYFKNANEAAKKIGCSHVLAVKVLRGEFKKARGWSLSYIDRMSKEGLEANVDTRTRKEREVELKQKLMKERKEHVRAMNISPKDAHAVVATSIDGQTKTVYPNIYQAEKRLHAHKVLLAVLGIRPTAAGMTWNWLVD